MDLYLAYICPGSESLHGWKGPKCNILLLLDRSGKDQHNREAKHYELCQAARHALVTNELRARDDLGAREKRVKGALSFLEKGMALCQVHDRDFGVACKWSWQHVPRLRGDSEMGLDEETEKKLAKVDKELSAERESSSKRVDPRLSGQKRKLRADAFCQHWLVGHGHTPVLELQYPAHVPTHVPFQPPQVAAGPGAPTGGGSVKSLYHFCKLPGHWKSSCPSLTYVPGGRVYERLIGSAPRMGWPVVRWQGIVAREVSTPHSKGGQR
jgi:hypothetical protein